MKPDNLLLSLYFLGADLPLEALDEVFLYRTECIASVKEWGGVALLNDSYTEIFKSYASHFKEFFQSHFKGKRIIELGPAENPLAEKLFSLGAEHYTAVEPFYGFRTKERLKSFNGKADLVEEEGLSYLLAQPDASAIVVSCGVFCPELFRNQDYLFFLAKEVYRITPKGCITFHAGQVPMLKNFEGIGFSPAIDEKRSKNRDYNEVWKK